MVIKNDLPSVVKTSTSHKDSEPSDPTNCKNTYCPIRVRAQVNDFVEPSSET